MQGVRRRRMREQLSEIQRFIVYLRTVTYVRLAGVIRQCI